MVFATIAGLVVVATPPGRQAFGVSPFCLNPVMIEVAILSGLADQLGRDRMLFNARAAIEHDQALQTAIATDSGGS